MPFVVTATDRTKPVSIEVGTAKEATENAVELLGRGMRDVAITDLINARRYRSGEFHLLLNERGKFNA
jgi:hypothetical protein